MKRVLAFLMAALCGSHAFSQAASLHFGRGGFPIDELAGNGSPIWSPEPRPLQAGAQ